MVCTQTHSNKNVNIDKKKFMKLFVQTCKRRYEHIICKKLKLKETFGKNLIWKMTKKMGMPLF